MTHPPERLINALEGRYGIEGVIGEGGMATVYLAEDLKHHRKVALKVLRPELASVIGAERFLAEIETTANLTHPNILPLHDSGEADGLIFFVMPYVEDETLRQRLDREKQLPVDEAVRIASEVADALDHAHRRGIIHRDIKPANILLRDGRPLVTDFGIALATSRSGAGERLTETGMSLGTPYYMSPEQAIGGHQIGPATDIYALGCVLYEMLVGEPPYTGSTPQAVLGKIITADRRRVSEQRPTVPPHVDAVLAKALERVPADRFRSAAEFARALGDEGFRAGGSPGRGIASDPGLWNPLSITLAGIVTILVVALGWISLRPPAPRPVSRFAVTVPDSVVLDDPVVGINVDVSPDGSSIVFAARAPSGGTRLWTRRMDALSLVPIPGTAGAQQPRFSPDGREVAFTDDDGIKVIPVGGASPRTLLVDSIVGRGGGLSWAADGMIYFRGEGRRIWRLPEGGGKPEAVTTLTGEESAHYVPRVLPNGRGMLFTVQNGPANEYEIAVMDLATGETRPLIPGAISEYVPSGHIVYESADGTSLMAVAFDPDELNVTGPPRSVLQGIWSRVPAPFAVSEHGDMVYSRGLQESVGRGPARQIVWVDRSGTEQAVDSALRVQGFQWVALSPNGRGLATSIIRDPYQNLWVKDLPNGPLVRLTTSALTQNPAWTPDGERIAYIAVTARGDSGQARTIRSDGSSSGRSEVLVRGKRPVFEVAFAPDRPELVLREGNAAVGAADVALLDLETDSVRDLLATRFNERAVALSPDGHWLAYVSDVSGQDEVYVRPFPSVQRGRWQVSRNGGGEPVWAHNGRELFYREPLTASMGGRSGFLVVATYTTVPSFRIQGREPLFDAGRYVAAETGGVVSIGHAYDVSKDDQRFLMIRANAGPGDATPQFVVVRNFIEELKEAGEN